MNNLLALYKEMISIRAFEEEICPYIENGEIKTPCHLYIGQEAIAVGICSELSNNDLIWGNHRSHGHYLAKGGDLDKLMSEIFCKADGCSGGRGGSMHILDKEVGILGTVPIVAGTVPLAVGAALKFKLDQENYVSVSFMGDGATEEGHVIESMNMASLYQLPILFIIENNLYSSHMHMKERRKQEDLQEIGVHLGIPSFKIDGNNVREVQNTAKSCIKKIRENDGPAIIECMTYRWRGHVGASWDEDVGVKRKMELNEWLEKDPIQIEKENIIKEGVPLADIESLDKSVRDRILNSIEKSLASPYPATESILDNVFCE
jgi:pyruvate dehydrogenase E1 component alpha subunit